MMNEKEQLWFNLRKHRLFFESWIYIFEKHDIPV